MSETINRTSAGLNGDFEITVSGLPVNWILYTPKTVPDADFDLIIDTEEFKSGKQSLKFIVRECTQTGGWHSPGFTREIDAIPGANYRVTFWIKNAGSEYRFIVGGVSAKTGEYGVDMRSSESIDEWRKIEYDFKMPDSYKRLKFELNILKPGTIWIDDLKVEEIADPLN